MKTKKIIQLLVVTTAIVPFLTSCDKKEVDVKTPTIETGVYVLNQGSLNANNASLTYYDFSTKYASGDIFLDKNNRGLGDTGQDMIRYGSKLYIAVYNSNIVEVVDVKTANSIKSISLDVPRSLTAYKGKVYIVQYNGHVIPLDTTTLTLGTAITVGANPDKSVIANNKLYVANTGGMAAQYDSTVSVIDLTKFQELKKITINQNPSDIHADSQGNIFVLSNGNYGLRIPYVPGKFQRIDAITEKLTDVNVKARGFTVADDKAYIYNFDYDKSWQAMNKKISVYDLKNNTMLQDSIVTTVIAKTPYCIDVDPLTKDIYLGVTDYTNNGKMYCYKNDGTFKFSFGTGVNPTKVVFLYNK